jgi:hypothetical protein
MSAIDTGISALNNAVAQATGGGPITNPADTVGNLQAAGNVAVTSVGPAIDALSGSNPGVMNLTHMAWVENGKLSGVNNGASATAADVASAAASVTQIATLYGQAQRLAQPPPAAKAPAYTPPTTPYYAPPPPMPGAPPPDASPVTAKRVITTGAGMGAGLLIGARLAGLAVGGPVGALIGAGLGWVLGR